jgi:hypothetical protein
MAQVRKTGSLRMNCSLASKGSGMAFCDSLAITPNRASAAVSPRCPCKTVTAILFDTIVDCFHLEPPILDLNLQYHGSKKKTTE